MKKVNQFLVAVAMVVAKRGTIATILIVQTWSLPTSTRMATVQAAYQSARGIAIKTAIVPPD